MKIGRNDPCPCGSGKKYKKCCEAADQQKARAELDQQQQQQTEGSADTPGNKPEPAPAPAPKFTPKATTPTHLRRGMRPRRV
jgi:hypothetical protein